MSRHMSPRRLPLVLALLAVAAGGAVVGAGAAVVGTTGKVVVGAGKAVIPGESKKDREEREFKEWKKSQRDG